MALKGTPKFATECCSSSSSPSPFAAQQTPPSSLTTLEVTVLYAEEVVLGDPELRKRLDREGAVLSAEEVVLLGDTDRRKRLKRGAYAVVHTDTSAARTRFNDEDGNCNGYPYWGEAVRVTVSDRAAAIDVEIYRRRRDGRAESVAAARVPVADFSGGPVGHLHILSYRLFDSGSRMMIRNGIVNISVKRLDGAPPPPRESGKGGKSVDDAATASGSDDSCCGGVEKEGKVPSASAAAAVAALPAGVVMGYPLGFNAAGAGQASGKGSA